MFAALKTAWEGVVMINPTVEGTESSAQFVQIAPPTDVAVTILFEVRMGGTRHAMSICIPYNVLKPVTGRLSAQKWFSGGTRKATTTTRLHLSNQVQDSNVELSVCLGKTVLSMGEFVALRPGDVLPLAQPVTEPLTLSVAGVPKFQGRPRHAGQEDRVRRRRPHPGQSLVNHPELLPKLTSLQTALWPAVSNQVGETTGLVVQVNSPLVLESKVEETVQEFATPGILVQFALAGQRDSAQWMTVPLDTAAALYAAAVDDGTELGEDTIEGLRPFLEAVVQGLCIGLGNAQNDVVVATDVSVRIGRFSRPSSMQPSDPLFRVQVALGIDSTIGSLTWLFDAAAAHAIAGLQPAAETASPAFGNLPPFGGSRSEPEEAYGLGMLMDIPLDISVELGRTRLVVKEVVDLGVGSIVEIDKAAGDPIDILVNGRLVARGEVVVIEDNFGVRITEILNPRERIASLGQAA